jgi:hypothetical protein
MQIMQLARYKMTQLLWKIIKKIYQESWCTQVRIQQCASFLKVKKHLHMCVCVCVDMNNDSYAMCCIGTTGNNSHNLCISLHLHKYIMAKTDGMFCSCLRWNIMHAMAYTYPSFLLTTLEMNRLLLITAGAGLTAKQRICIYITITIIQLGMK